MAARRRGEPPPGALTLLPRPLVTGLREQVRRSGATSAGPYGYTLTVWGSGMVAAKELGPPGVVEALLFVAGAVMAFVLVEAAAHGGVRPRATERPDRVMALWGNAHLPAAGGAMLLVWLAAIVLSDGVAWPVGGFLATVSYLVVSALQSLVAGRIQQRRARSPG